MWLYLANYRLFITNPTQIPANDLFMVGIKMNYLKIERERLISDLRESSLQKEKVMCDNFNNSIVQHRKRAEDLKVQKGELERSLMKEAEEKINAATSDLDLLK